MNDTLKRLTDITIALPCLVAAMPFALFVYIVIKLEDHGPVFYFQERIGKGGKPFNIIKFRTMSVNTEEDGVPQLAEANDDRLTTVGKFLRSHHLDEIPQLWNVLRGDMSLVGYRPERKYFVDQIMEHDQRYTRLYEIRPGVTSYATLHNGYTDTMEKMLIRLDMDLHYLEHRSLWLDMRILVQTFFNIANGKKF